jgi:hypothetical protein
MKLSRSSKNVHQLEIEGTKMQLAVIGDVHWDNPKCDRDKLKRDLDYCLENNIPILGIGDWFCIMQGKGDRRGNKSDIRPEHNNARYFDSIVETALEFFSPYAHLIQVVGYGNHETAIIKFQETDILARFVDLMNYKNGSKIQTGGYGGWFCVRMNIGNKIVNFKIKYFHGSGGGGPVTQGAINLTRALGKMEGADVYCMGHIHENSCRVNVRETLKQSKNGFEIHHQEIHMMVAGCYKEEWNGGHSGWHVERGAGIKPIGGRILNLEMYRDKTNGLDRLIKKVDSQRFP